MSMRKDHGRSRALRPSAESLEGRRLLSATVSGTDTAGDKWTLTLLGKGSLQVLKQDDSTGSPAALSSATEIKSITVSGTDPGNSRLIGTVTPATGSDGRVFFNNLTEIPNRSDLQANGLGLLAINMPNFWLGDTGTTAPSSSSTTPLAEINIPDGVNSLRFGGVDATKFFGTDATQGPSGDGLTDQYLVKLGLPAEIGTSIVVDKVISSAQAGQPPQARRPPTRRPRRTSSSRWLAGSTCSRPTRSTATPSTPRRAAASPAARSWRPSPDATSGVTGEIGFVRVGGNATNFSVVTNDGMSNFYVGGETNNISILAPGGTRNLFFGKGADTATIQTHSIENLDANRGMLNSNITSERMIGDIMLGGDVANSRVLSGYQAGLAAIESSVQTNLGTPTNTTAAPSITPTAQAGGKISAFIAGNVTNSVFAASDLPISQVETSTTQTFGNSQDALLPLGHVLARVEGTIDNSTATPDAPTTAFFARTVNLTHAPVTPPQVVEPPLPPPATPITLPGIPKVFPASTSTSTTKPLNGRTTPVNLVPDNGLVTLHTAAVKAKATTTVKKA